MKALSYAADVIRNRVGLRTLPRFLTYLVTFSCNARCVMCDSWRKPSPDDLTLSELDAIFAQLPRLDAVRITGGEPFVRTDLLGMAEIVQARLRPLVLHITTNGFLTDRIVDFSERRPRSLPLRVLVSLDGLESRHNAIRGRSTAFASAVATLRALAPRRAELNLHLSVNQTIVDAEGFDDYRRLRDFLAPMGIRNQAVIAYRASATYSLEPGVELASSFESGFPFPSEVPAWRLDRFLTEAEADAQVLPTPERMARMYYLEGVRRRMLEAQNDPNPPCVALNSHLRILPNGDVPTCQFNTRIAGNLRRQPFLEVWFGPRAREQRAWVRRCKGCWAECEVLPSAIYTADLLRALRPKKARGTLNPNSGVPHPAPGPAPA